MKVFILPISGGGFAAQLGIMYHLLNAKRIEPDIVMGSSGGNAAAYISMLSNWFAPTILKNCHLIDSNLFVEPWTPSFFPTWLLFPFTKSIFRMGDGLTRLFQNLFTPRSIIQNEIWTGVYNETRQKAKFVCNLSEEKAKIKSCDKNDFIYDSEPVEYLNGDITLSSQYSYGSAAIPYLTPGIEINGEKYLDGGAAYASPIIPLSSKLKKAVRNNGNRIQMYYFCSYDMDEMFSDDIYSSSVGLLIHSSLLKDRAFALSFLQNFGTCDPVPKVYREVDSETIKKVFDENENKNYLMVFSPVGAPSVSIVKFTGLDLQKKVKSVKFSIYLWALN